MIVLDTNVVSELMKAEPDARVVAWVNPIELGDLFVASITRAELLYGIAILPEGKRQTELARRVRLTFDAYFGRRVLPFDADAADVFADIASQRRARGHPISQSDAQIAAVARCRGAALATRNVADFVDCGVEVINPWIAA